jgi:hypothetical protein
LATGAAKMPINGSIRLPKVSHLFFSSFLHILFYFVVMLGCLDFVIFCVKGRKVPLWLGIMILLVPFYVDFGIIITNQHGTFVSKFGYAMINRNVPVIMGSNGDCSNIIFSGIFLNGYPLQW